MSTKAIEMDRGDGRAVISFLRTVVAKKSIDLTDYVSCWRLAGLLANQAIAVSGIRRKAFRRIETIVKRSVSTLGCHNDNGAYMIGALPSSQEFEDMRQSITNKVESVREAERRAAFHSE
ncbi:MAG TPA: hypothetical protein VJJ47_03660 [Candidatus Paceibacterota bacterium]